MCLKYIKFSSQNLGNGGGDKNGRRWTTFGFEIEIILDRLAARSVLCGPRASRSVLCSSHTFNSHHDTHASRSIFLIHFSNFLINYMIKIIYLFSSKYLKKEKKSYTLFKETIFQNNAYFESHIFW